MQAKTVLLLDLDPRNRHGLGLKNLAESDSGLVFESHCHDGWQAVPSPEEMQALLDSIKPDLVFMASGDLHALATQGAFKTLRTAQAGLPVVLAMEERSMAPLLGMLHHGLTDFVTLPLRLADILPRFNRLLDRVRKEDPLVIRLKEKLGLRNMIGGSPRFLEEIRKIPLLARCDANVLISGETGTGKEMCARATHYLSSRSAKPFVAVNCGALPADLIENELFGHEREAFTGAGQARPGLIKEADGGTLFLDEVDSLPALAQVKLLRFLQEKEYRPLGSTKTLKADIRILAASNLDLEKAVSEGKMRQDLYYRLNVVSLNLPPLRERREDIPSLLEHFAGKYAEEYRLGSFEWSPEAMRKLTAYSWPGNIRQMEHVVQRAILMAPSPLLTAEDFCLPLDRNSPPAGVSFQAAKAELIGHFERDYIRSLLITHKGNISHAAVTANKNRRAFWQLMRKYGIDADECRADCLN